MKLTKYQGQDCGTYTPIPKYIFMGWCLVQHRDNFTFTLSWPIKTYRNVS